MPLGRLYQLYMVTFRQRCLWTELPGVQVFGLVRSCEIQRASSSDKVNNPLGIMHPQGQSFHSEKKGRRRTNWHESMSSRCDCPSLLRMGGQSELWPCMHLLEPNTYPNTECEVPKTDPAYQRAYSRLNGLMQHTALLRLVEIAPRIIVRLTRPSDCRASSTLTEAATSLLQGDVEHCICIALGWPGNCVLFSHATWREKGGLLSAALRIHLTRKGRRGSEPIGNF